MSLIDGFEHIVRENEPLAPFTQLKLGGTADYFAEPTTESELIGLVKRFSQHSLPVRMIGNGSNILVRNNSVPGLTIRLTAADFARIEIEGQTLTAGGGTQISHFVASAVREGFAGPEHLVGLPGTVGGALFTNAGANSGGIGTWVESIELLTHQGERITKQQESLAFAYLRGNISELVILRAKFAFEREPAEQLTKQMQKRWIVRRASQPTWEEKAALIFKDQGGESAASLIEQAGLKGTRVGGAAISAKNANYVVVDGTATSDDVIHLIDMVKQSVMDQLDIELEPAITIW